jgi:hypothetical protein
MLLVFALSVTPRKYLHDELANHTDGEPRQFSGYAPHFQSYQYYCKCDDLVAESPFIAPAEFCCYFCPGYFAVVPAQRLEIVCTSSPCFFHRRGPPALV